MDGQTVNPLQAGGEAISLDMARGALLGGAEPEQKQDAQPQAAPERQPAASHEQDQAQEAEPAADEAQPETETTEQAEADLPPIEPPASWKAADKEWFRSLPREAQQIIADRERSRETATNRALQEAAEARKAAEAERQAALNERQQYQQQLNAIVPALQQQLANEFADIKTPADVMALAQNDPARYALWRAKQDAIAYAMQEQQRLAEQQRAEAAERAQAYLKEQRGKLIEKLPELASPEKYKAFASELSAYLRDEGFSDDEIAQLVDHRAALIARKAMLYDRAQKAAAAAKAKPVPKVQQPGTALTKADRAAEERAAKLKRLEKTGSLEDARGLLRL